MVWVLFLLSEILISGPMIRFFHLTALGGSKGFVTKIKILAVAFCKTRRVNSRSIKPCNGVHITWNGDFSSVGGSFSLLPKPEEELAREKTSGNETGPGEGGPAPSPAGSISPPALREK